MAACQSSIEEGGFIRRWRFWVLALLWLPAGVVAVATGRFAEDGGSAVEQAMGLLMVPMMVVSLVPVAPCGLPLALGCRQLWRLGYRRAAWMAGDRAWCRHGGGVAGRGTARPGRDRGLCGGAQHACVDRVVLAFTAGMNGSVGGRSMCEMERER